MKRFIALMLGVLLIISCTACGNKQDTPAQNNETNQEDKQDANNEQESSKTVVVAIGAGFSTLDPGYVYEKYPPVVVNACYENLFKFYTNDGEPQPCLADSYEFSEDNLKLTVKLKDNAKFASGNAVTSNDVKFSINRCKNLQGNPSFICDNIDGIETPDDKTVIFNLKKPDSAMLSKLTYSSLAILDSKIVIENGGTDKEDASTADKAQSYLDKTSAGSGMYVMTSYIPDQEIVLEKNENYWGTPTNVDKFIVKIQPDSNTQMMTLSTGDIDVAMNMTDDTMMELDGNDSITKLNSPTKTVSFVMMNMDKTYGGPVSDPTVQKAIRKALDYKGIQTICGQGTVTPYDIIQVGFMGSKGEKSTDYTNIDEAKKLLEDAGYKDGFDIDLTVCDLDMEGVLLTDLAQKVKDDLSKININVNIVSQPWAAGYGDAYRDGTLGFTVMYWGIDYNDPNVQLEFLPGAVVGLRAGWKAEMDTELAAMYELAMSSTKAEDRIKVLEKVQDAMYESGPFVMIAQAPSHVAYNNRLDGVFASDPYAIDLTQIKVK